MVPATATVTATSTATTTTAMTTTTATTTTPQTHNTRRRMTWISNSLVSMYVLKHPVNVPPQF